MLMHGSMQGRWVPQEKESKGFDSMEKKKKRGAGGGGRESYKVNRERENSKKKKIGRLDRGKRWNTTIVK